MIKSMYSGVSGLRAHQTKMDVIGNNIANVNTVGFKASRVTFQDVYSQTVKASSENNVNIGGTNPQQIGLGVSIGTIDTLFTASGPQRTENPLDVAIEGDGFFILQDPSGTGELYSRAGNFYIDNDGILVNGNGLLVLNEDLDEVDTSTYTNVSIDKNGVIKGINSSGNEANIANLGVANFVNPAGLEKVGNSCYRETANSGAVLNDDDLIAGENGSGFLNVGALEMSNVDLAKEFTEMIVTQRGYQANSRVITTSDQLLEELVNLKR